MKLIAPLRLGLALLLSGALLGGWGAFLGAQPGSVRVANRSTQVLRGVQVCVVGGSCFRRAQLRPHESWRVPAAGQSRCLHLEVEGRKAGLTCARVTRGQGVQFVVREGGWVRRHSPREALFN